MRQHWMTWMTGALAAALLMIASPAARADTETDDEPGAKAEGKAEDKAGDKAAEKPKVNAYEEMAEGNKWAVWANRTRDDKQAKFSMRRAARHYKRAVEAAPVTYAVAHYNLGQIYQALGELDQAAMHYRAYLATGEDAGTRAAAEGAIKQCVQADWPRLTVSVTPVESALVTVNGVVLARRGDALKDVPMPPGDYTILVHVEDHGDQTRTVSLKRGTPPPSEVVTVALEKMTFYGTFSLSLEQKDARVRLLPKQLDKPGAMAQAADFGNVPSKPVKLPTGKYLLEVTHPEHFKWVRHIYIRRDSDTPVEVKLSPLPPPELRVEGVEY